MIHSVFNTTDLSVILHHTIFNIYPALINKNKMRSLQIYEYIDF